MPDDFVEAGVCQGIPQSSEVVRANLRVRKNECITVRQTGSSNELTGRTEQPRPELNFVPARAELHRHLDNRRHEAASYWRSYSPFPTFFKMVKPAFFASLTETGLLAFGVLKLETIFRTGFLQSGHCSSAGRLTGRLS